MSAPNTKTIFNIIYCNWITTFVKYKKKTLLCIRGHPQFLKIYAGSETCEVSRNLELRQGIYKDALVIMTPI